ncbi:T6SS phospholipase effector Tle1-like catalytic domain-containing protein, partial [Pseudomonas agarici]
THELVSQIVLHDLYAAAFLAGAPLQVPEAVLPKYLSSQAQWRTLGRDTLEEFNVSPAVIERFNAWRSKTLPVITTDQPVNHPAGEYTPLLLGTTVEEGMADQLGWITGWRIGRYA